MRCIPWLLNGWRRMKRNQLVSMNWVCIYAGVVSAFTVRLASWWAMKYWLGWLLQCNGSFSIHWVGVHLRSISVLYSENFTIFSNLFTKHCSVSLTEILRLHFSSALATRWRSFLNKSIWKYFNALKTFNDTYKYWKSLPFDHRQKLGQISFVYCFVPILHQ